MNYFSFKSLTMMFVQNFKKSPDGNEKKNEKNIDFFFLVAVLCLLPKR